MSKKQTQARWRAATGLKRVEVCLDSATVQALDDIAKARGMSRAGAIAALVAEQPASAREDPQPGTISWRKAKPADRSGVFAYEWIAAVDGEPMFGLKRDDVHGWRGKYINESMSYRWAKDKTRDAVVAALLELPEAYR